MKPKTKRKLEKREQRKPKHHIDSGIIIEIIKKTRLEESCKKYLNLVGYKYRGCFSLPVLGELLMKTYVDVKNEVEREIFLRWLFETIDYRKIDFYTLKNLDLPSKLNKIDGRVKGTDALILACTIEDKAKLITLDEDLHNSVEIQKKYKAEIKYPSELI